MPVSRNGDVFAFGGIDLAPSGIAPNIETAQLLYRAQDITVGKRDGRPSVKATYTESAPIAGQSMVTCMIGDLRVTAIVDGYFRAEPGAEVELCFLRDPDAVFDNAGKRVTA